MRAQITVIAPRAPRSPMRAKDLHGAGSAEQNTVAATWSAVSVG
ncbi:hypothetical protein [Streptomyces sp. NPDC048496]